MYRIDDKCSVERRATMLSNDSGRMIAVTKSGWPDPAI